MSQSPNVENLLWLGFFFGFAVKIPIFPFHIWLPEAHVEAPTNGSILLAALLLKLGGYGLLRVSLPLFTKASFFFAPYLCGICILGVIYSSLTAIRQIDLKKIIAYSSVAHMNFAVLGIFSFTFEGLQGSIFLMFGHGIVSSALFLLVGVLYDKYHIRHIYSFGGLVQVMPKFSFFFLAFMLANISLPGTCNFIGELLVFVGLFSRYFLFSIIPGIGVVLSAVYSI